MATKPMNLDCGDVLSELTWLRGLARSLGADAHLAEDLTQATVLAAMEHPPRTAGPIRGWLATVLRNLFRQTTRGRVRRLARETRGARSEAVGPAADVVERAAVQKRVVDAVMALDEPYRTTVLLRFFEGLPPRRIAARAGVPVATVKTRLARALERLRVRLDEDHGGDRRAWLVALLVPLPHVAVQTAVTGAIIMSAKAKVAACAAVVLLGVGGWLAADQLGSDRESIPDAAAAGRETGQPAAEREQGKAGAGSVPRIVAKPYAEADPQGAAADATAPAAPVSAAGTAETVATVRRVRGRVLDTKSQPAASVRVVFKPDERKDQAPEATPHSEPPSAVSGSDGVFEMAAPSRPGTLDAQSPRHVTVLSGIFDPATAAVEPIIVVAPMVRVAGHVLDEQRRPLPGAAVSVELPGDFRSGFSQILDYSLRREFVARTDLDGAFVIDSAPDVAGANLSTYLEGWEKRADPLPGGAVSELEIVLRKTRAMPDTITGRVVDHAGVGVTAARISTRDRTTRSDESGRFTIKLDGGVEGIIALKDGFLPATLGLDAANPPEQPVVLRLEGAPLVISGRVVDGDGKPLADIRVWTQDPTLFASTRDEGMQFVENLLGGSEPRGFWLPVRSDGEGRFALRGLLPREYRVHAMDPKTLAMVDAGPVKAGSTDVVVTLPGGEMHETVAGVIVSLTGSPVQNVTVTPQRDTFTFSMGGGSATAHADTEAVSTDGQGRFRLRNVPREGVYLRIQGAEIIPREFGRGEGLEAAAKGQDLAKLRIEVSVRCHFKVDLGDEPDMADQIGILDAKDAEVPIDVFEARGRLTRDRVPIENGHTSVLAVPQDSRTLVLFKKDREVARKPLRLVPGSVTTVKP